MKTAGVGLSLRSTASPPKSCSASRCKPPLSRSAKKPTAVSDATAKVTATISKRNSPERKSRHKERHPRRQKEIVMARPYLKRVATGGAAPKRPTDRPEMRAFSASQKAR